MTADPLLIVSGAGLPSSVWDELRGARVPSRVAPSPGRSGTLVTGVVVRVLGTRRPGRRCGPCAGGLPEEQAAELGAATVELATGHLPMLERPRELAALVAQAS